MTPYEKQKRQEREAFDQFLSLQNILDFKVSFKSLESPDFIIELPNNKLGVEVTDLNLSQEKRKNQSNKEKILQKTKQLCVEQGVQNLAVTIIYSSLTGTPNPHYRVSTLTRTKINDISNRLADIIIKKATKLYDQERAEFRPDNIPEVSKVFVNKNSIKTTKNHFWQFTNEGWVSTRASQHIQNAINEKNKLYEKYLENCDECWLLLVAKSINPSQRFSPDKETLIQSYHSNFSRIFYLERTHSVLKELKLIK